MGTQSPAASRWPRWAPSHTGLRPWMVGAGAGVLPGWAGGQWRKDTVGFAFTPCLARAAASFGVPLLALWDATRRLA